MIGYLEQNSLNCADATQSLYVQSCPDYRAAAISNVPPGKISLGSTTWRKEEMKLAVLTAIKASFSNCFSDPYAMSPCNKKIKNHINFTVKCSW